MPRVRRYGQTGGVLLLVACGLLFLVGAFCVAAASPVRIQVVPHAVMVGGTVQITCRVPRDADHRWLTFGFTNWTTSGRQLDGAEAPITWQEVFSHVPCDPGRGFCEVLSTGGRVERVVDAPLLVGGCS